jgi:hypothetical protein
MCQCDLLFLHRLHPDATASASLNSSAVMSSMGVMVPQYPCNPPASRVQWGMSNQNENWGYPWHVPNWMEPPPADMPEIQFWHEPQVVAKVLEIVATRRIGPLSADDEFDAATKEEKK